jgi:hypothetical protein
MVVTHHHMDCIGLKIGLPCCLDFDLLGMQSQRGLFRCNGNERCTATQFGIQLSGPTIRLRFRYHATMSITTNKLKVLVRGDLPHPTHDNEHDDNYDAVHHDIELDWEIGSDDEGHKCVLLTLSKAMPIAGVTVRWSRPIRQQAPVGVDDRSCTNTRKDIAFPRAWD